jgi:hypothetical protein
LDRERALKIILVGFAVTRWVAAIFDLLGVDLKRPGRTGMRTMNGHDLGAHYFPADLNLDHFTVARFSGLVLRFGKFEFRFARLPRFDVPDILTRHLSGSLDRNPR